MPRIWDFCNEINRLRLASTEISFGTTSWCHCAGSSPRSVLSVGADGCIVLYNPNAQLVRVLVSNRGSDACRDAFFRTRNPGLHRQPVDAGQFPFPNRHRSWAGARLKNPAQVFRQNRRKHCYLQGGLGSDQHRTHVVRHPHRFQRRHRPHREPRPPKVGCSQDSRAHRAVPEEQLKGVPVPDVTCNDSLYALRASDGKCNIMLIPKTALRVRYQRYS